jgi:hypothetical protein
MSDEVTAILITIAIIALCLVWVPLLDLVCPPCARFLERLRHRTAVPGQQSSVGTVRQKTS